jgi:hypothetical protein
LSAAVPPSGIVAVIILATLGADHRHRPCWRSSDVGVHYAPGGLTSSTPSCHDYGRRPSVRRAPNPQPVAPPIVWRRRPSMLRAEPVVHSPIPSIPESRLKSSPMNVSPIRSPLGEQLGKAHGKLTDIQQQHVRSVARFGELAVITQAKWRPITRVKPRKLPT